MVRVNGLLLLPCHHLCAKPEVLYDFEPVRMNHPDLDHFG